MKILIDIGHPGHVHLFRPFAHEMDRKGHKILFTYRQKEFERELLEAEGFKKMCFGKHFNSKIGKLFGLIKFNIQMLWVVLTYNPKILLSHGSIYAAQIAWLTGKTHIALEDSGNMEQIRLYLPFTRLVLTPDVLLEDLGSRQVTYRGYHELFYLHPKYFAPNRNKIKSLGINKEDKYIILRFVSFNATHDYGQGGLTLNEKRKIVEAIIKTNYKLFITSEGKLPKALERYRINIQPHLIHHALFFASLVVSEGATIASEAGVLGTPAIYVNSISRSYNEDQEKFGLVFNFRNGRNVLSKIQEILENNSTHHYADKRKKLLSEKICPTCFLVWFIENYPASRIKIRDNPDFVNNFK